MYQISQSTPLSIYSNSWLQWREEHWQQQITDDEYAGETGIHSVQNGILMDSSTHFFFDKYLLAINPDVRITEVLLLQVTDNRYVLE
jgi:hypothetical protein